MRGSRSGEKIHRAVHHPPDPRPPQHRHALHRLRHVVLHAREVVGQQLVAEVRRRPVRRPVRAGRFVHPEQQTLAFLAHVEARVGVVDHGQLAVHGLDLGDRPGDDVMVLDRHQRQPHPGERRHLPRPQPRRVHHVLGDHRALRGHHLPPAAGARMGSDHRAMAHDLRSAVARALGERLRDAARIDVAAAPLVHHAPHAGEVEDRYEGLGVGLGEPFRGEAHAARSRPEQLQLLHAPFRAREHDPSHVVEAAGLAGLRFERRVELERVALQPGHGRVGRERTGSARRVPRRPRRQLAAFDEQAVGPAGARQVVEHAATGDAAADDDDPGMGSHGGGPSLPPVRPGVRHIVRHVHGTPMMRQAPPPGNRPARRFRTVSAAPERTAVPEGPGGITPPDYVQSSANSPSFPVAPAFARMTGNDRLSRGLCPGFPGARPNRATLPLPPHTEDV